MGSGRGKTQRTRASLAGQVVAGVYSVPVVDDYDEVVRLDERTECIDERGLKHRLDGPAVEYADGETEWWMDGRLHRDGGPAIESPDGTKKWYQNGLRDRVGGPAVEMPDGSKYWF